MGNTKSSNIQSQQRRASDVKRQLNRQGYSASDLEILQVLREVGNDPKMAAGIIYSRRLRKGRLPSHKGSSNKTKTVLDTTTSTPPKRKRDIVNEAFQQHQQQLNMPSTSIKGGDGGILIEGGEHKRSRVKLYDTNLLEGKQDVSNIPKVDPPTPIASSDAPPTVASSSVAEIEDMWRDSRPIDPSIKNDKIINEAIENLQSNVKGTEFSFPTSWPVTPSPVLVHNNSPRSVKSTQAAAAESEEVVVEMEENNQSSSEPEHYSKMLGMLRRRLGGLQKALEEESRKWQGSNVKERSQAVNRVLEQIKLTGFGQLSENMKQNVVNETGLLLERLSSSCTSDGNVAQAQIELAALMIKEVRISVEKVFKGIIYDYVEKFKQKPSPESQDGQGGGGGAILANHTERSMRANTPPDVMNYDPSASQLSAPSTSKKLDTMETSLSEFEANIKQANDTVSTMGQSLTKLHYLQNSNIESVDSIRSILSKLSKKTSELRSLIKRKRVTLEEKQHEKDISHSKFQELIPPSKDLSDVMDAVQVGDVKVQEAFEQRKLAMLEMKKAERALDSAQTDYITHSSTVAMCVALVEGLSESFTKFIKGQLEEVQQTMSEGNKLFLSVLKSMKRSSEGILNFTDQSSTVALKAVKERKAELLTHTKLFGSASPENETRLKTLVYEMEQAYEFSTAKADGVIRGLLDLRERLNLLLNAKSMENVDILGQEIFNSEAGRRALAAYRLKPAETNANLPETCTLQ